MDNNSLKNVYESHHAKNREDTYSILEKERGELFSAALGEGKKVLDIGCRDGTLTRHFAKGNTVLGADIDEKALAVLSRGLGIRTIAMDLNGDWRELCGEHFGAVVAGEILEHLYYPEQVVERTTKHLFPGGIFVGSVPNAFNLKNRIRLFFGRKHYTPLGDPTHINHFLYRELIEILSKYFLDVKIIGLGRYVFLAKICPSLFAFDLVFICKNTKHK